MDKEGCKIHKWKYDKILKRWACSVCEKINDKSYRNWSFDEQRLYMEKFKRKYNGERDNSLAKKYYRKNEEKVKCRQLLSSKLKNGSIKRGKCVICNKENAEAHHNNYNKPFEVIWFCRLHHRLYHRDARH